MFRCPKRTSRARNQKRRPLFLANIPPKWWNRHSFHAFSNFGWLLSKFWKIAFLGHSELFFFEHGPKNWLETCRVNLRASDQTQMFLSWVRWGKCHHGRGAQPHSIAFATPFLKCMQHHFIHYNFFFHLLERRKVKVGVMCPNCKIYKDFWSVDDWPLNW